MIFPVQWETTAMQQKSANSASARRKLSVGGWEQVAKPKVMRVAGLSRGATENGLSPSLAQRAEAVTLSLMRL
jgi:hypothetical protein